jgi:hypothetical protein
MLWKTTFMLLLLASGAVSEGCLGSDSAGVAFTVTRETSIENAQLSELSGLVKSQLFDEVYWAHNDSGDSPRVFALDREGRSLCPQFLKSCRTQEIGERDWPGQAIELAMNYDWEDVAILQGDLLIADIGNNGNARRDLGIYRVPEFNPETVERTRALTFYPIRYPEQRNFPAERWEFDAEALFTDGAEVFLITKHRESGQISQFKRGAKLYRVPLRSSIEPNVLEWVAERDDLAVVTAADVSSDGLYLAVLGYQTLWLFGRPEQSEDHWFSSLRGQLDLRSFGMGQVEALTFLGPSSLMVANEGGDRFRVDFVNALPLEQARDE